MNKTCQITLYPLGRKIRVNAGTNLGDAVYDLGVEFPCGGKGLCGNCKVKLIEGDISLTDQHAAILRKKNLDNSWRLACLSNVEQDITIEIAQLEHIILADDTVFNFTPQPCCGIAVDLGSTTIVSQLLDMENGQVLAVQTDLNPQARYGADIMSRVGFALQGNEQAHLLMNLVRETIGGQISRLVEKTPRPISKVRIVGNSVMHHLFCGLDISPLAAYPFESPENGMVRFSTDELSWSLDSQTEITFLPNVGSFVGSDILAGIYAAGMFNSNKPRVLVDLGTNGEIAVGHGNRIVCASTAAGPAFEGSNISCGMRASTGAISSIECPALTVDTKTDCPDKVYHIIGNVPAKGICGSGLIDALYLGTQDGTLLPDGVIALLPPELPLTNGLALQQKDVREFQLAKAAIAAGIQLLLNQLGLKHTDIEKVFIAGGFGNYIHLQNAIGLGLLEFEAEKITKLSNSALIGTKMMLFQEDDFIDRLLPSLSHLSLETAPGFLDTYCEKMQF